MENYVTDGIRLFRVDAQLKGGRGVILEDARTEQILSMTLKEFLALKSVKRSKKRPRVVG